MAEDESELRFTEPTTLAAGEARLAVLKQAVEEANASLTAINKQRPPRSQPANYQDWVQKRGRRISAQRKVVAEYSFIKQWVRNKRAEASSAPAPHRQLATLSHVMLAFEDLHGAVGAFLQSDGDDDSVRKLLQRHYERVSSMIAE